jgi:hypothetical protein
MCRAFLQTAKPEKSLRKKHCVQFACRSRYPLADALRSLRKARESGSMTRKHITSNSLSFPPALITKRSDFKADFSQK